MSSLAATQIPKPADEQAFERACVVLWRHLLGDPNVQRHGRRGQRQHGVDLYGIRNGNPAHLVGIQCKLKGPDQELDEEEIREEFEKAAGFRPDLTEYFIVTTAPDDARLQELARTLASDLAKSGRRLSFAVWGWNTLEERISEYSDVIHAFDPSHTPFGSTLFGQLDKVHDDHAIARAENNKNFGIIAKSLTKVQGLIRQVVASADAVESDNVSQHLNAEIDGYRSLLNLGKGRTALELLERLLARLGESASEIVLFRIKANIASCRLSLGDPVAASVLMLEAFEHAPNDRRAIANKALALCLRQDWRSAITFCQQELGRDPSNEWVASYLIQAASHVEEIHEPLALVPSGLHESKYVVTAMTVFLRDRSQIPAWWNAARKARTLDSENDICRQYAAESVLDEISRDLHFARTGFLSGAQRARLGEAARVLSDIWHKALRSEASPNSESVGACCNLIATHRLLDEWSDALKVARAGIAAGVNHEAFLTYAMLAAAEGGDRELATELVGKLPRTSEADTLRFMHFAESRDWVALAQLDEGFVNGVSAGDRELARTAIELSKIRVGQAERRREKLEALVLSVKADTRSSVIVADCAKELGFGDILAVGFENAIRSVDERSHAAERRMAALFSARIGKWAEVADLLDRRVSEDVDSEELKALATAFANDLPIRQRALRFLERLPPDVASGSVYLRCAGLIYFNNGDLLKAEEKLRQCVDADPADLHGILSLISTLHRRSNREEIDKFVGRLDLSKLRGTPHQKVMLAQALSESGDVERALPLAYSALIEGHDDARVIMAYFGLVVVGAAGRAIPRPSAVATDCWVSLKGENDQVFAFLIDEGPAAPSVNKLTRRHPIVSAVLGLSVGESFRRHLPVGPEQVWRVQEIKHKYLFGLHAGMENFGLRFPDQKGFHQVPVTEGDITPILNEVRKQAESNAEVAAMYGTANVPLPMIAARLGGSVVDFANYLRVLGLDIATCVGSRPELRQAHELIRRHKHRGIVLDTYTAWVVAELEQFETLTALFDELVVPQSTIDDIAEMQREGTGATSSRMTLAWHNGQFVRQELTAADLDGQRHWIDKQRAAIEKYCLVRSVAAPDERVPLSEAILSTFGNHALDVVTLTSQGLVLVSDDLYHRQIAKVLCETDGLWLQVIFKHAFSLGIMNRLGYARAIAALASRRHAHIELDENLLADILDLDISDNLQLFAAAVRYLGVAKADVVAHLSVCRAFLALVWDKKFPPSVRRRRATSMVLESLLRFQWARWPLFLAAVRSSPSGELFDFVALWVRGHFLDVGGLDARQADVLSAFIMRDQRRDDVHRDRLMSGVSSTALGIALQ